MLIQTTTQRRYATLFQLRIESAYYADRRCRALEVQLEAASATSLARLGGVLQARPGGVDLTVDVDARGRPLVRPESGFGTTSLAFSLRVVDPRLFLFSELGGLAGLAGPVFRNRGRRGGNLSLEDAGDRATAPGESQTLARVEISGFTSTWLATRGAGVTPCFRVELPPKALHWVYYLATPSREAPGIVDRTPSPERVLRFGPAIANAALAGDPLAALCRERFTASDLRHYRLVSQEALPCRENSRFLKVQGSGRVLPNPPLDQQGFVLVDGVPRACRYHHFLLPPACSA